MRTTGSLHSLMSSVTRTPFARWSDHLNLISNLICCQEVFFAFPGLKLQTCPTILSKRWTLCSSRGCGNDDIIRYFRFSSRLYDVNTIMFISLWNNLRIFNINIHIINLITILLTYIHSSNLNLILFKWINNNKITYTD